MMDKKFQEALQAAKKTVDSWPAWKQNSLLVTTMATTPCPRQPVEHVPRTPYEKTPSTGPDPRSCRMNAKKIVRICT